MGSTYGTQNLCADYGDIVAHIDIKIGADEHMHLGNSTKIRGVDNDQDVRQISCCINRSDLCWKDQVEKITSGSNAGTVRVYRVENGQRMQSHEDVSTHQARFDLCERWPDYIYCEVDPEGDAFTDPSPPVADLRARTCGTANTRACNCGDHFCDEGDCEWHWQQSSASQTCIILSDSISMPANDGTTYECTVQARCRGGWGGGRNYPTSYTGNMTVFPRLSNCSGTLRLGAC